MLHSGELSIQEPLWLWLHLGLALRSVQLCSYSTVGGWFSFFSPLNPSISSLEQSGNFSEI